MQPDDNNPHTYFARAEEAFAAGDKRATGILLNQVLLREFTHKQAWRILHSLYGAEQVFEVFQYKFTRQNYPDKIHLLTTIPAWISEVEPEALSANSPANSESNSQPAHFHHHQSAANQPASDAHPTTSQQTPKPAGVNILQLAAAIFQYKAIFLMTLLLLFLPAGCLLAGTWSVKSNKITPTVIAPALTATSMPSSEANKNTSLETGNSANPPTGSETPSGEPQETTHQAAVHDPLELIHAYTNAINTRDYAAAWASLSPNFIEKMSTQLGHPYTYADDFVASWSTLASLEILEASAESSDAQSASVLLKLRWNMTSGKAPVSSQRFQLVRNANSNAWLIDAIETLK
jgi:hypothetical protein